MEKRIAARTEREIVRLCHSGLDSRRLRIEAIRRLRNVIPIDSFWFATADPTTLLFTSSVVEEIPEVATRWFVANEFERADVNKWVALARAGRPTSSLYLATGGKPESSPRYRDILAPLGFGDELRAVVRDGGASWGFICLHRERASEGFTPEDASFLARVTPHLAIGLRNALLLVDAEVETATDGPGLLVLAHDLSVLATTPAADGWLSELADWPQRGELPETIYGLAARLRALENASPTLPHLMPRARARTASGRWVTLHAAHLTGRAMEERIAVMIEPTPPAEVAPLALLAYDLTQRETAVAERVLRGLSTAEIANELSIAALTVQQHLKAVFDKMGVRSRRDLVAHVFNQQYLPRIRSGYHPRANGWFDG